MNMFEIAVVNKPSVFQPLKFYCSKVQWLLGFLHLVFSLISFPFSMLFLSLTAHLQKTELVFERHLL